jgi:hypothetical protein
MKQGGPMAADPVYLAYRVSALSVE